MSRLLGKFGAATADDVAEWFKLKGASQFPPEGIEQPIFVQHHEIWVDPKRPRMTLRAMTRCNDCGKVLPVGRLAQHDRMLHKAR